MKAKLIALIALVSIAFSSCSLGDDDALEYRLQVVGITDVEILDPFVFGQVNEIIVKYNIPNTCQKFLGFDVNRDLNQREIYVVTEYIGDPNCLEQNIPEEQSLRFLPTSNGTIVLKFYTGNNDNGEREFIEIVVDVQE